MDLAVELERCYDHCCGNEYGHLSDEEYGEQMVEDIDPCLQYACLFLILENGLDLLEGLKSLRRLRIEKLSHCIGVEEKEWIMENWPDFEQPSRDTFWTERGHAIEPRKDDPDKEEK